MKWFGWCAFFVLVFASTQAVNAQTSIYGSVNDTEYGFTSSGSNDFNYSPHGSNYSYYSASFGVEAGGTYLFPSRSRLKAGIDLREIYSFGSKGGNAGFGSLRIAFVPRRKPVSPYFQLGAGYIHVPLPGAEYVVGDGSGNVTQVIHQSSVTGGAADLAFGVEVRTNTHWSIRAIEFGGYAGPRVGLATIGAGVIYTLP